ncbi:MAG: nucleotidyltransferase family protein [Pseudomonadota bacterium]
MMPPLMLFAAGRGTRMGSLTRARPKPLIPVAGRPLVDHALDLAREAGVTRIVANTHYLAAQMEAHLHPHDVITHRESVLLETGGGLKAALDRLGGDPVFTLNADAVWAGGSNPLTRLHGTWHEGCEGLLLLVPRRDAVSHTGAGDFHLRPDGRLQRRGVELEADYVYAGAQLMRTGPVAGMPGDAFSLNAVWDGMLARGTLYGVVHDGRWADVGRPEGIAAAEAMLDGVDP